MYKTAHRGFELAASLSAVIGGCVARASCEPVEKPADGADPAAPRLPWTLSGMSHAPEASHPLESLVEMSPAAAGGAGLGRIEPADPDLAGTARRLWGAADGSTASRLDEGVPPEVDAAVLGSAASAGAASAGAASAGAASAVCTLAPEPPAMAGAQASPAGEVWHGTTEAPADSGAPEADLGAVDWSAIESEMSASAAEQTGAPESANPLFDAGDDSPGRVPPTQQGWRPEDTVSWFMPDDEMPVAQPRTRSSEPWLPEPRLSKERLSSEHTEHPAPDHPAAAQVRESAAERPVLEPEGLPLLTHGARRLEPAPKPGPEAGATGRTRSVASTVESLWLSWPPRPSWLDRVLPQDRVMPGRAGWASQTASSTRAESMTESGSRARVPAWLRTGPRGQLRHGQLRHLRLGDGWLRHGRLRHWQPPARFVPLIAGLVVMACVGGLLLIQFGAGRAGTPRAALGQETALIMPGLAPNSSKVARIGTTGEMPALIPAPAAQSPAPSTPAPSTPSLSAPAAGLQAVAGPPAPAVTPVARPGSKAPVTHPVNNPSGATHRSASAASRSSSSAHLGDEADSREHHTRYRPHRSSHDRYADDDELDDLDGGLGGGLIGGLTDTLTDTLLGN